VDEAALIECEKVWISGHVFKNSKQRRDDLDAVVDGFLNGGSWEVALISFQVRKNFL